MFLVFGRIALKHIHTEPYLFFFVTETFSKHKFIITLSAIFSKVKAYKYLLFLIMCCLLRQSITDIYSIQGPITMMNCSVSERALTESPVGKEVDRLFEMAH